MMETTWFDKHYNKRRILAKDSHDQAIKFIMARIDVAMRMEARAMNIDDSELRASVLSKAEWLLTH